MSTSAERDLRWEGETIAFALELCQRAYGITPASYAAAVQRRLADGELEHGDAWSRRPPGENLAEALQEPPDAASWTLLELQLRRPEMDEDRWQEVRMLAVRAIATAAAAHEQLQDVVRALG
jgi:hypothetical protein